MRICVAQICAAKGDMIKSIEDHHRFIAQAVDLDADLICFPELSLGGYEPTSAKQLALKENDPLLETFQMLSNKGSICICLGFPLMDDCNDVRISMAIFQKDKERLIYSKQLLHEDELPFFKEGEKHKMIHIREQHIVPAICYESLMESHAEEAANMDATMYLASVAKGSTGIAKAYTHYSRMAKKHSFLLSMSNCIGQCDNFSSVGQSGFWDEKGKLLCSLDAQQEGLLLYDTKKNEIISQYS